MKTTDTKNLIDEHFGTYIERAVEPTEKLEAVTPYLKNISEDFDEKLFDYIEEVQKDAYYAGFATAMQLAADCYAEKKRLNERG